MTTLPNPPPVDLQRLIDMHLACILPMDEEIKSFAPTLIVQHFDPARDKAGMDVLVLAVNFNEPEEKHNTLTQLGKKYYDDRLLPSGVALASEAWVSSQLNSMPSLADDRKEVIIIAAQGIKKGDPDYLRAGGFMPLNRDKKGNIIKSTFVQNDNITFCFSLLDYFYEGFFGEILRKKGRR